MNMPDWLGVALFAVAVALVALLFFVLFREYMDCRNEGGTMVRTLMGYACMKGL